MVKDQWEKGYTKIGEFAHILYYAHKLQNATITCFDDTVIKKNVYGKFKVKKHPKLYIPSTVNFKKKKSKCIE